jgi:hypothetical protein
MPTDLEAVIRDALRSRAEAVVPRHDQLRARRDRRWWPPALAAASVVLLAVVISLVVTTRSDDHGSAASPAAALVGYEWRLEAVEDSHGRVTVPLSLHAWVGFTPDGSIRADDTVNAYGGSYRLTDRGYSPSDVFTTDVGSTAAADSERGRVIAAIESVMYIITSRPTATPLLSLDVAASVAGDTLTLHGAGGSTLTLRRDGPLHNDPPASRTNTH